METTRRFSRLKLQSVGLLAGKVYIIGLCLFAFGVFGLTVRGKAPYSFAFSSSLAAYSFAGFALLVFLPIITLRKFNPLLWLHEQIHIISARALGVPRGSIGYIANPNQPGVGASLTFINAPKPVWEFLTVAPMIIPLVVLIIFWRLSGPFMGLLLGLSVLTTSFNDIAYALVVLFTPGRFVTTTEDEIIVSWRPLAGVPENLPE